MRVGIVIITYNNENHIEDAFNSVVNQSYSDWTCVMIDNGSTDSTFEIMQRLAEGDERFSAFKKLNEGPAAGRNLGYSKFPEEVEYLHFLDGDDLIKPSYLATMVDYLDSHPSVGLVACQFDEINNDGDFIGKGHRSRFAPNKWGLPQDIPLQVRPTPFVSFFASTGVGPFGVYRNSVFKLTNGYNLKSQEDTDMFCKMSLLAEVHYLPEFLYVKRRTGSNLAHKKSYTATHRVFRHKWDMYEGKSPEEQKMIEQSIRYYYGRHVPLRDLKVGSKAFRNFLKSGELHSLKWSIQCFSNGFVDFFFRRNFKKVMRERNASQDSKNSN